MQSETNGASRQHLIPQPDTGDEKTLAVAGVDAAAPPCFFWSWCAQRSAMEKAGRSVCQKCAPMLRGFEYPLRMPETDMEDPAYILPVEDIELIEL